LISGHAVERAFKTALACRRLFPPNYVFYRWLCHSPLVGPAFSVRGRKVHGTICGNRRKTTNLIMAPRGKHWLAPMLFKASCTAQTVLAWREQMLLKELKVPSGIIMDKAAFHPKGRIRGLLEAAGHVLRCLPAYSPDMNPTE